MVGSQNFAFLSFRRVLTSLGAVAAAMALAACGGGNSEPEAVPEPIIVPTASVPACPATSAAITPISAIQGATLRSPLEGSVVTTQGVVTGDFRGSDKLGGFFIQQVTGTFTANASRGIFVFSPGNTQTFAVGNYVQLSGSVNEFGSSSITATNVATQLSTPTGIISCGTTTMPAPMTLSMPVVTATSLELAEGMLVRFEQPLSVSEVFGLGRFGELVLSAGGRQFHPNNGNAAVTNAQNLLARIILDDASSRQYPNPMPYLSSADTNGTRRLGDTVTGLQGILSYGFNSYRVQPTQAATFVAANPRSAAAPALAGTLKVASFNVLNYFTEFGPPNRGANNAAEFARQKAKTIEAIVGLDADVLGLIEMQNNGDTAVNDLVAALNARLGAGTYAAVGSGTIGGDQIKVDIIYRPARVLKLGNPQLPSGADLVPFSASGTNRPPLAQRFSAVSNSGSFWFVANHFKSKGSCPSSGDVDLGQGCWNILRTQQASALNGFVSSLRATSGEQDVLMMGDFNAYLEEDPTDILEAASHESLLKRMPVANRYTYVFGGETGALDHAYASSSLRSQVSAINVWHINGDEPPILDYNTEDKTDDRYAATAYRSSDHDPVMVGLTLVADSAVCIPSVAASVPAAATVGQSITLTGIVTSLSAPACPALQSLSINWGAGAGPQSLATSATVASNVYATTGAFTIRLSLADASGTLATLTRQITVNPGASGPGPGPGPVAGATATLIFSEYIEGSSNNKALEIYNAGTSTLSLSDFAVRLYSNGNSTPTNSLTLTGTLSPGGFVILVFPSSTATLLSTSGAITSSVTNFNGNDAVTIERVAGGVVGSVVGSVVDRIGQVGVNPGTEWAGAGISTLNRTLRRKAAITRGDTASTATFDPSVQWDGFAIDTFGGLGSR